MMLQKAGGGSSLAILSTDSEFVAEHEATARRSVPVLLRSEDFERLVRLARNYLENVERYDMGKTVVVFFASEEERAEFVELLKSAISPNVVYKLIEGKPT